MRTSPRILVVEDDGALLDTLANMLAAEGYTVDMAATVDEALDCLGSNDYEGLLVDLVLGDRSGEEILHYLDVSLRSPPRRIVFMTGTKRSPAAEGRPVELLAKPFLREDLLRALRTP